MHVGVIVWSLVLYRYSYGLMLHALYYSTLNAVYMVTTAHMK